MFLFKPTYNKFFVNTIAYEDRQIIIQDDNNNIIENYTVDENVQKLLFHRKMLNAPHLLLKKSIQHNIETFKLRCKHKKSVKATLEQNKNQYYYNRNDTNIFLQHFFQVLK